MADHSPGFHALILGALEPERFRVRQAVTGEAVLTTVAANPPALILLSLHLKGLDSLEVCRRLSADGATRHIPVILIGRAADARKLEAGLQLGAADFVTTPFHPAVLRARISLNLAHAGARRALIESEARNRLMFESNPLPMYLFDDATLRFLAVNNAAVAQYGYSREEFLAMRLEDIRPVDEVDRLHAVLVPPRQGFNQFGVWRHRTKDGAIIDADITTHSFEFDERAVTMVMAQDITERRKAAQSLQESEERLRLALAATRQGLYDLNVQTEVVRVNAEYAIMLGYDPATFRETAHDWWDTMHPDDRGGVFRAFEDYEAGRRDDFRVEFRVRTREGGWKWIQSTGTLVSRTPDGRPLRMVGTRLDITERREAEEALRASEARYRAVAESANLGIVTTDSGGRIVSWNRGAEVMFGFTESEMLGRLLAELMPRRYREPRLLELQQMQAKGGPPPSGTVVELEGRRKDGTDFQLELSLAKWEVAEGWFITAMMMDITGRRHTEASLLLQSAALNAAANAIVITDREGTIVWANPAFTTLTGYSAEEAIGANPRDLLRSGRHEPEFYARMWETILGGGVWQGEMTNRRKDGSLYPERMVITPVRTPDGEASHFIAIKEDLTAEKALQGQLIQAQKMEAVGRLTGGIAHDFNNILMAILGYSDFLIDGLRSAPHLIGDAQEIRKAVDRAVSLTRQLLAFSRKQVLTPTQIDLNRVVTDLGRLLRRLLGEDIELSTVLAPDLGTVHADPGQVEQVIMNLAVNARDAMPTGGPLEIRTTNTDLDESYAQGHRYVAPGRYVALWVTDRGTGIPSEFLPHLFEPYFTSKEVGKGTGLGLATVFGIVKQSGGHIEVYSEVGFGSTFKVYLPRVDGAVAPASAPVLPVRTALCGTETVLVADDDQVIGGLIERALVENGYQVLLASGPAQAVELARSHTGALDVLVTDVVMPGQGGQELAAEVTALWPGIKVVYMSGYTGDAIAHRGLLEARVPILTKPVSRTTLLRAVRDVLDGAPDA